MIPIKNVSITKLYICVMRTDDCEDRCIMNANIPHMHKRISTVKLPFFCFEQHRECHCEEV
jgi:hypothetical protein